MCGIAGFIGKSKSPDVSFRLLTALFREAESRGIDAAGYWGVSADNVSFHHKEPLRSSRFIQSHCWKSINPTSPLLLTHARSASVGVGSPLENENNHPFVSNNGNIGLVHNGRIPDEEYLSLLKKYSVSSSCDSEVLLRILEQGIGRSDFLKNMDGIRNIWREIIDGEMAVAIGTLSGSKKRLWLFRNEHRSLYLADLQQSIGQIFFFSSIEMWRNAVFNSGFLFDWFSSIAVAVLPIEEIRVFELGNKLVENKFAVERKIPIELAAAVSRFRKLLDNTLLKYG